jgi:hypothetical protein
LLHRLVHTKFLVHLLVLVAKEIPIQSDDRGLISIVQQP